MQSPGAQRENFGQSCRKHLRTSVVAIIAICGAGVPLFAQSPSLPDRIAEGWLAAINGGNIHWDWSDADTGVRVKALEDTWYNTANGEYFQAIRGAVDAALDHPDESPQAPDAADLLGRGILFVYRVTLDPKYYAAVQTLRRNVAVACSPLPVPEHPPESQPCREEPFLAEYASVFQEPEAFASITRSFLQWDKHIDPGIAGPREVPESDDVAHFAADLLAADLVDALQYYPANDPGRSQLIATLRRHKTFLESHIAPRDGAQHPSSSSLAVYAIAKGVRLGYLPAQDSAMAARAWRDLLRAQTPKTADGAFLLAANEMELASAATSARGRTVMLDAWYNSQQRKNAAGQTEYFHYKWNDFTDNGFSLFAHIWQAHGARTDTLYRTPDAAKLRGVDYYIIVSPDIPKKNPNPHYMNEQEASAVVEWVRQGGVLILMENDPPNADLAHLNLLADRFGIHFDDVLHHHIIGEQVEDGRIPVAAGGPLFKRDHTLYMKDTCAISLHGSAQELLRDRGDVVMATAKSGRGTVFAMVDPWLYNEYTDGRKNPVIYGRFDNFAAGKEFVEWLIQQQPRTKSAPPAGSSRP